PCEPTPYSQQEIAQPGLAYHSRDGHGGAFRFGGLQYPQRGRAMSGGPPMAKVRSQINAIPPINPFHIVNHSMQIHSFHIPVMGIAFTVDTPLKVAPMGIDSAISLVDDVLLEKLRKMYCEKFQVPYIEIHDNIQDFRAKRITSYLNLIQELAQRKFEQLKDLTQGYSQGLLDYIELLPKASTLGKKIRELVQDPGNLGPLRDFLDQ